MVLNFILNSFIIDCIILILFFVNSILTIIIDYKQTKTVLDDIAKLNIVLKCKLGIIVFSLLSFILFLYIKFNDFLILLLYLIIPSFLLIKNLYETYTNKKKNSLSIDDKYTKLWSAFIFIIFFSSQATPIYYTTLSQLNHEFQEFLLILYLLAKIILFTFLLFTNIAILISNVCTLKPIELTEKCPTIQYYKPKDYDFILYNKYNRKIFFVIDFIIYVLLCIPTLILNIICIIFLKGTSRFKRILNILFHKIYNFNNSSNEIIKKITNISVVSSFSIVSIIIILYKSIFTSQTIIDIYNFISTVILIPFIYDSIKSE